MLEHDTSQNNWMCTLKKNKNNFFLFPGMPFHPVQYPAVIWNLVRRSPRAAILPRLPAANSITIIARYGCSIPLFALQKKNPISLKNLYLEIHFPPSSFPKLPSIQVINPLLYRALHMRAIASAWEKKPRQIETRLRSTELIPQSCVLKGGSAHTLEKPERGCVVVFSAGKLINKSSVSSCGSCNLAL